MARDQVFSEPRSQIVDFAFDETVASVFPDMIRRSVPGYELVVPMTELASRGVYEVELQRHDGIPEKRVVARNAPTDEGRLVAYDEGAFKKQYPQSVHDLVTFVRDQEGLGSEFGEGATWPLLAILLLFGLLAESLLAWRFGRR